MRASSALLLALPALVAASESQSGVVNVGMTGGWHSTNVTDDNTKVLSNALTTGVYTEKVGTTRVCYHEVTAVESQVVAGTNYRFHISGCNVTDTDGECSEDTLSSCEVGKFVVQVFYQSWTSTLKITKISKEGGGSITTSTSTSKTEDVQSAELSDGEKQAIDLWIAANGLNKFGDEATRMYVGGTPLFDESTGVSKDRYDYIMNHHQDRPWQEEAETATQLANSEPEAETGGGGSVAGVLAMLGVFTVVLAVVAVLKLHQGRRANRFQYDPIRNHA